MILREQVIQRRDDFGEPRENFNRDWADYKNGFGDPSKEFWLGNENIYMLTNNEDYALRVELEDFEGNKRHVLFLLFLLQIKIQNNSFIQNILYHKTNC